MCRALDRAARYIECASAKYSGRTLSAPLRAPYPLEGQKNIQQSAAEQRSKRTNQPGWKWSIHNAPTVGTRLCHAPHTGTVLSGHGIVEYEDGTRLDLLP